MKTIDQLTHPSDIYLHARGRTLTQAEGQKLLSRLKHAPARLSKEVRLARAAVVAAVSAGSRQ